MAAVELNLENCISPVYSNWIIFSQQKTINESEEVKNNKIYILKIFILKKSQTFKDTLLPFPLASYIQPLYINDNFNA